MKKIGIVTFCKTKNNYGTILQNYALQTFLKNKNFETYLIKTGRTEKKITVSSRLKKLRKFTFKDIFIKLFSQISSISASVIMSNLSTLFSIFLRKSSSAKGSSFTE